MAPPALSPPSSPSTVAPSYHNGSRNFSPQPASGRPPSMSSPHEGDDDGMTEDEVALMVKNAMRKARNAVSFPATMADACDDGSSSVDDEARFTSSQQTEADLARRIEEEIKGARAFAEKMYYGSKSCTSASSRNDEPTLADGDGAKRMVGRHERAQSRNPPPASCSNSPSSTHPARSTAAAAVVHVEEKNRPPEPSKLSRHVEKKDVSGSHTINTHRQPEKSVAKQQNRKVTFRHPYTLPPPPVPPRSDSVIISKNDCRQAALQFRFVEPDTDLSALIHAATDDSLVRRSNACGALKVLASKESNRAKMCRTRGLLEALLSASKDDAVDSNALDARTRAVSTLLYLAEPKDNRLILARHSNMIDVLVKVITEDTGEARLRACCTLATLAKTPQNRGLICKTVKLPEVLSRLMVEDALPQPTDLERTRSQPESIGISRSSNTAESRDDSTIREEDDSSASFNSNDDRMFSNTYSGTFSYGTSTFTDDQDYSDDDDESAESILTNDDDDDGYSSVDYSDEGSEQEDEGVEVQISSLKKLNIENHSEILARSQLSACATLTHLTKHCANAPLLAQNETVLETILLIASIFDNPLHTRCIEIICNLTRFPSNNGRLASKSNVIETLLTCGKSEIPEDRLWAVRTVQNLCSDASSKVTLATGAILSMLSTSAMRKDYDEQFAAVGALMNLSTEPGSIVPLTNTKTVIATLVHLAHSPNTPSAVREIACNSLATIGLWLQTLASTGTVPEEIPFSPLPTHSPIGWLRWES